MSRPEDRPSPTSRSRVLGGRRARGIPWVLLVLAAGCAQHHPSPVVELDAKLSGRLGQAHREDVVALLGEPEVKDAIGATEVWVYQFKGTGGANRVSAVLKEVANYYDELIMTFDGDGILQKYNAVVMGPGTHRGRK